MVSGLDLNYEFEDLSDCTWEDAKAALELEQSLIDRYVADPALFIDEVDNDSELELDIVQTLQGLDEGIAAAVMALNARGCPTFNSCNGLHPQHGFDQATIVFFASRSDAEVVFRAAGKAGVTFLGESSGRLELCATDPRAFVRFAEALIDGR